MSVPVKLDLQYKYEGNNVFTLRVNAVQNSTYVWQYCKFRTAEWITLETNTSNTRKINVKKHENRGDKYRCLLFKDNEVIYYSVVFTLNDEKYIPPKKQKDNKEEQRRAEEEERRRQDQQSSNRYRKGPSVEDTDGMNGFEFEDYCACVLNNNGFENVRLTRGRGDYGIDILAEMNDITYAIQCKCYSGSVSNKAVQEAFSGKSFYGCMVAAVLTNSYFTPAAKETARRTSVLLWDRDFLDGLIKKPFKNKSQSDYDEEKKYQQQDTGTSGKSYMDFFKGCHNLDQVKARYKTLSKTYHPDVEAGDEDIMKIINAQYDEHKRKYVQ